MRLAPEPLVSRAIVTPMRRHVPNFLTLGRILLVPALVFALYQQDHAWNWIALVLFILAGVTDALDGHLARRFESHSQLGQMLDPIADKLLVAAAIVMLVANATISGLTLIPALIILGREILLSGLREYLATLDVAMPVSRIAKFKTGLQMLAIGMLIGGAALEDAIPGALFAGIAALWIAAALTLYTGYNYLVAGLKHLDAEPRERELER
jgi:CDP-diacylglycerol--glycerol-3-phosphate 3-phosphatidyltransferase